MIKIVKAYHFGVVRNKEDVRKFLRFPVPFIYVTLLLTLRATFVCRFGVWALRADLDHRVL